MSYGQSSHYLKSKVLTAPSHRLHLMLIEGALRFGRQAEDALRLGDSEAASLPLARLIDIVGELLAGVRQTKTDLNQKIAGFYLYLFRTVVEAKVHGRIEQLAEAIRLLELERETWQLVCQKLGGEPSAPHPAVTPLHSHIGAASTRSLSLEA